MNRIKKLRKQKGITVKDLADKLGIAQSMLTNYENGGSMPRNVAFWDELAGILGVSAGYLMGVTNSIAEDEGFEDSSHFSFLVLDEKAIREKIAKPVEVTIDTPESYALLANIGQLPDDELTKLLADVQKTIRTKYAGRLTEFRLPDKDEATE